MRYGEREERAIGEFEADLPRNLHDGLASWAANGGSLLGPRALMLAVLEDAIHCAGLPVHEPRVERRRLRDRARAWMRSGDGDWLFSFESICDALSIDANRLRRRVLRERPARSPARHRRMHGLPRPPARLKGR